MKQITTRALNSSIALSLAACLLLAACSSDQITASLELAVDAAIAAAPAVEAAAGVSPDVQGIVSNYLGATETCLTSADGVLGSATVNAGAAAAQIAAACSADLLKGPALPAGTPTNVILAVQALSQALAKFLSAIPSTKTVSLYLAHPAMVSGFAGPQRSSSAKLKLDRKRLVRIHAKLAALRAKLVGRAPGR